MMFIYNRWTGKMYNMDKIVDIFPGKTPGDVSIGLEGGSLTVFAKYDTGYEAMEMIAMMAEAMATSRITVFTAPDPETVKARAAHRRAGKYHNIAGKKTKGHGSGKEIIHESWRSDGQEKILRDRIIRM